jgi:hypothetical protein
VSGKGRKAVQNNADFPLADLAEGTMGAIRFACGYVTLALDHPV